MPRIIVSAHHELAKCFISLHQPVLDLYSSVENFFTFAKNMQSLNFDSEVNFFCSFDISCLFENIPLKETIHICADTLYNIPPTILKALFTDILTPTATSVELNFNHTKRKQIGGFAMCFLLSLALANIFVR